MPACEVCARKGVLIFPVRYAIACPAGAAGVPGLAGNFKIENAPADIGKAKYTLRSMRAGYMYAYDEKRKRLRAYMVMPQGLLWNFPLEHLPPSPKSVVFGCANHAEVAFRRCVDIVHGAGDLATNLWIGWSSVVWTKDVIDKVGDGAWRKKHMQCINVPAMLAGTAGHTADFAKHHKEIAHFGADQAAILKAFAFSNTPTGFEVHQQALASPIVETMAAHAPYKTGFIVALNDPVGITNDLSELTLPTVDAGFDEDVARGKMVYELLVSAEKSVRADARQSVITSDTMALAAKNNTEGDTYNGFRSLGQLIKFRGFGNYEAQLKADKKKYGDSQAGRLSAAADHAWEELITEEKGGKREPLLDAGRFKNFPATYANAIKEFQPENEKLARSHVAWLVSEQLANWMEGVHDTKDIRSGYAFSESLAQCIGKGVSSEPCSEQLLTWLDSGKLSDPRNLYARALLFNHDELIKATEPGIKASDIQYENVLNMYKVTLFRLDKGHAAGLKDRMALGTMNILVKALKSSTYSVMHCLAKLHLTLVGQVHITQNMSSPAELGAWVLQQANTRGIQLHQNDEHNQHAANRAAHKAIRNAGPKSGVIAFEIDMERLQREGVINEHTIKKVKVPGFDLTEKWLGSSAPREFHLGVVTAIVQILVLGCAVNDIANEDQFNSTERNFKGIAAIVGLSATLVDIAASTVEKAPRHPLAAFLPLQWALDADRAKFVAKVAQKIGCLAGIVTGLYDVFINAWGAFTDGKNTLAGMYFINGALGIAVAVTGYFTMAIFWPLLVLSIIVGIAVGLMGSGALQDWVSRCYFSNGVSGLRAATHGKAPFKSYPYPTANDEFKAYKTATGT